MAFDVQYSRSPFTDALLALFAGRAQAERQNQLAESQMDFSAAQQSARSLSQGLGQFSGYLFNRDLQGRQMEGQSALEQLRQQAYNQRQQAALGQQREMFYGGNPDQLMQMYPQARTPAEASDLNKVDRFYARVGPVAGASPIPPGDGAVMPGAPMVGPPAPGAAMQGLMDGVMKQAGLEPAYQDHTINSIGQIQTGLLRSMNDPTLTPQQKQMAIDKATNDLVMTAVPTIGRRVSPPNFQELAQQGRMMMPPGPGFSNVLAFDEKGVPKGITMHPNMPEAPKFITDPETGDRYYSGDGKSWKPVERKGEMDTAKNVRQRRLDAERELQAERSGVMGQLLGGKVTSKDVVNKALENDEEDRQIMAGLDARKTAEANAEQVRMNAQQARIGQAMIDTNRRPSPQDWVKDKTYYIPTGDGRWFESRFLGLTPDGREMFDTQIVERRPDAGTNP